MDVNNNSPIYNSVLRPTAGNLFGSLFISFFIMMIIVTFMQYGINLIIKNQRDAFLVASIVQSVFLFIFPSVLTAYLCEKKPLSYLGFKQQVYYREFIGVVIFLFIAMPFLNLIIEWNAGLTFPDKFKAIESQMRIWEEAAQETTNMVLGDTSLWGLLSGILVVGCVTGLAEELFFRAGIQKAFISRGVNHHLAIWITALIFSTIHFQFFGFFPRVLIGAFLGYLFFYTGSIWISAFAHMLNNSIVVISTWCAARGFYETNIENIGTINGGSVWFSLISLIFIIIFVCFFGRKIFCPNTKLKS